MIYQITELDGRINQDRHAITKARELGKDTSQWEQHLVMLEKAREDSINLQEAKYKYLQKKIKELNSWCKTKKRIERYSDLIKTDKYAKEEKKVDDAYMDSLIPCE